MKNTYYVAFHNKNAENPFLVDCVLPPLEIEYCEEEELKGRIIQGIAAAKGISAEDIDLLYFGLPRWSGTHPSYTKP